MGEVLARNGFRDGSILSYAHDDDFPTSSAEDKEGFVTYLRRALVAELHNLGLPDGIVPVKSGSNDLRLGSDDLWSAETDNMIRDAELLLVVMSNNWVRRPYCRKELDTFVQLRKEACVDILERIIVVGKDPVDRETPVELQGQKEILFYEHDSQNGVTELFFNPEGPQDSRFKGKLHDLAVLLQRRVERVAGETVTGMPIPPELPSGAELREASLSLPLLSDEELLLHARSSKLSPEAPRATIADVSVYAPQFILRGQNCIVQVFVYDTDEDQITISRRAKESTLAQNDGESRR